MPMPTAADMLALYLAAEAAVLQGQRFRMGERELTRADLAEIRAGRREWSARVAVEANASACSMPGIALADFGGTR